MGRLPTRAILTYHSLDHSGSVLSTPPGTFAEQMRVLFELGVPVVGLNELRQAVRGASAAQDLVAVTFDDGFRSVYEHALPVLQRYGFPATVFLVTNYCGRTNGWPTQPIHVERRALFGWAEVKEMSRAGIGFGSHTRTHPDLTTLAGRQAKEELVASKQTIEDAIGRPVEALAYPYGACDARVKHLAQAHFRLACSTRLGLLGSGSDLFALERLDMYYLRGPVLLRRLFSGGLGTYLCLRRALRACRGRLPGWPGWR